MLARSSLETQKLELMANVADMKRRQALMERQHLEIQERAQRSEAELSNMLMQASLQNFSTLSEAYRLSAAA